MDEQPTSGSSHDTTEAADAGGRIGEDMGAPGAPASGAGQADEGSSDAHGGISVNVGHMVAQLQSMIEQVATVSTPALKEVAVKAADLAAEAARRAGPLAHTLADGTDTFGRWFAERAAAFAAEMRSTMTGPATGAGAVEPPAADAGSADAPSVPGDAGSEGHEAPPDAAVETGTAE
jgi:hypothetical protein